jgi:hypothetical protein
MGWDAFKHSPFRLASTAIYMGDLVPRQLTLCCHFIEKVNVLFNHRLVDLFRRQPGQPFPARALVGWFSWFLLFDEVVPLVDSVKYVVMAAEGVDRQREHVIIPWGRVCGLNLHWDSAL